MNPVQPPSATQLFVVHVWRRRTGFRASVRRVDDEQTLLFTSPLQLASYLCATSRHADAAFFGTAMHSRSGERA